MYIYTWIHIYINDNCSNTTWIANWASFSSELSMRSTVIIIC